MAAAFVEAPINPSSTSNGAPAALPVPSYASRYKYLALAFPHTHVLHVELNRGPVNAFNEEIWREYNDAFGHIGQDPSVRVVVLSSRMKKVFSAGADLASLQSPPTASEPVRRTFVLRSWLGEFQHAIGAPSRVPQPVLAAVHGVAFGLGLELIAACDVRWAAADAVFSIKEVDVGVPADLGALARLPKLVGNASLMRELAYTARNFGAEEALQLGAVSKVVAGSREDVIAAVLGLAREIAGKSPVAISGTKRFLTHALDHSVEDALEYQATWGGILVQGKDLIESAAAVARGQKIEYEDMGQVPQLGRAEL
ncbi:ClpP/crotonase [Gloeopeniophorella convolvens]|nr:ClpP/crotonase [Gloeopeniophorella convolvens]